MGYNKTIGADPGFPIGGGYDLLFGQMFAQNHMQMKKIEPNGGEGVGGGQYFTV